MQLEPKNITTQDVFDCFYQARDFIKNNITIYFVLWLGFAINILISIAFPYWFIVSPVFYALILIAMFELTCTLFVGYKGSLYNKLYISIVASYRTLKTLIIFKPFAVIIYLLVFYSIIVQSVILTEITNFQSFIYALKLLAVTGLFITNFYNVFNVIRLGCIAMFMKEINEFPAVEILMKQAVNSNLKVNFYTSTLGLFLMIVMIFTADLISSFLLSFIMVSGFFLFQKVFEPPMLKQQQEQEEKMPDIIPQTN